METLVAPPTGFRYAATIDQAAQQAEVAAVSNALETKSPVVADLTAIALLVAAGIDPATALRDFDEIIVSGVTARDAEMGRISLERRSTLFTGTDDNGQIRVNEISEDEAERRAVMAATIKDFVDTHCSVVEAKGGDDEAEHDGRSSLPCALQGNSVFRSSLMTYLSARSRYTTARQR